jgi:hypothetical protein
LTDLATDTRKQTAFAYNPEMVMELAGLSEADKAILKSSDANQISAAFTTKQTVLAVGCIEPGPDPLPDEDPFPSAPPEPSPSDRPVSSERL